MDEDVEAQTHVDEAIEAAPNRMDMDKVPPHVSFIHPLTIVPIRMLPTPNKQPIQSKPSIPEPHKEGTSNIILNLVHYKVLHCAQ